MSPTSLDSSASLSEVLHERALASAPKRLSLDIAIGLIVTVAALWLRPSGWVAVASAGLCLAAYGLWAIAERQLPVDEHDGATRPGRAWQVTHAVTAATGLVALVALLFSVLGLMLGTWIS